MPKIFVNRDNSNSKAKIYEPGKIGKSAARAQTMIDDLLWWMTALKTARKGVGST